MDRVCFALPVLEGKTEDQTSPLSTRRIRAASLAGMAKLESVRRP